MRARGDRLRRGLHPGRRRHGGPLLVRFLVRRGLDPGALAAGGRVRAADDAGAVGGAGSATWIFTFLVAGITPPAISNIGWRTYIVFAVLNVVFMPVIYFFFPEVRLHFPSA